MVWNIEWDVKRDERMTVTITIQINSSKPIVLDSSFKSEMLFKGVTTARGETVVVMSKRICFGRYRASWIVSCMTLNK